MSGRKVRVWRCPCCGSCWTRQKGEQLRRVWSTCRTCDRTLAAGRVVTYRHECRHSRSARRVREFDDRVGSKPRTRTHRSVRPSADVRALWADVRHARTRPAVVRRAQRFLDALLAETRDGRDPETGEIVRWTTTLRLRDGRVEVARHLGGMSGSPEVRLDATMYRGLHGEYRRSFRDGVYDVRLNPRDVEGRTVALDDLRATLVHEVLHVLDADAEIDRGSGHGRLWRLRLRRMIELFPPTAYGRRPSEEEVERWLR